MCGPARLPHLLPLAPSPSWQDACSLVFPCLCASSPTVTADFPPLASLHVLYLFILRPFGLTFGKYFLYRFPCHQGIL